MIKHVWNTVIISLCALYMCSVDMIRHCVSFASFGGLLYITYLLRMCLFSQILGDSSLSPFDQLMSKDEASWLEVEN